MKHLIPTLIIFSFMACSKSEEQIEIFLECNQIAENYKPYSGENIKCQFHFALTEYNNQQFIELIAPCADLTRSFVINENCEDICETLPHDENSECGKYLKDREVLEIIFIEK